MGPDVVVGAFNDNAILLDGAVVAIDAAILSNENSELGLPTVAGADTDGVGAVVGSEVFGEALNWKDGAGEAVASALGVEMDGVLAASDVTGAVVLKENAGVDAVDAGVELASEAFAGAAEDVGKLKEKAGGAPSDFVLGVDAVVGSEVAGLNEKPEVAVRAGTDAVSEAFDCELDEVGKVNENGDDAVSVLVMGVEDVFEASGAGVVLNENPEAAEKAGTVVPSAGFESVADVALVAVVEAGWLVAGDEPNEKDGVTVEPNEMAGILTLAVEEVASDVSAAFSAARAAADLNENAPVVEPNAEPTADGVPKGEVVAGTMLVRAEVVVVVPSDFSEVVADGKGVVAGLKLNALPVEEPPNAPTPDVVNFAEVSED